MDTQNQLAILPRPIYLPAILTSSGTAAPERFLEFFAANIRNPNTRRAYFRQVMQFLVWCEGESVTRLSDVRPLHVAAYIEGIRSPVLNLRRQVLCFCWRGFNRPS